MLEPWHSMDEALLARGGANIETLRTRARGYFGKDRHYGRIPRRLRFVLFDMAELDSPAYKSRLLLVVRSGSVRVTYYTAFGGDPDREAYSISKQFPAKLVPWFAQLAERWSMGVKLTVRDRLVSEEHS